MHSAMILAAGRGERMRPLTDSTPKPLLVAGGKPIVHWQLERLAVAGFRRVVINHAHLGHLIERGIGDGRQWGIEILYSAEQEALETAGGIRQALPLIDSECFAVVNGDIYTDFDYRKLPVRVEAMRANSRLHAHLVLVDNPAHNPDGDFFLEAGMLVETGRSKLTFSGIAVYRRELFEPLTPGAKHKLAPVLAGAKAARRVSAEHHRGVWFDIGTPQRLAELDGVLKEAGG
jgi:N-acetyl-alpha-D-muramate 1-phosphate uridylyltransferase